MYSKFMRLRLCALLMSLLTLTLAAGCSLGPSSTNEKGALRVVVNILPSTPSKGALDTLTLKEMKVTITKGTSTFSASATISGQTASASFQDLQIGDWSVEVEVTDTSDVTVFEGNTTATVTVGSTPAAVTVPVAPTPGDLAISISVPTGLGITKGTISLIDGAVTPPSPKDFTPGQSVTFSSLVPTKWTARVYLKNASDVVVSYGEKTVDLLPGRSNPLSFSSSDFSTSPGGLSLTVSIGQEPTAPQGLNASRGSSSVTLTWTSLSNPSGLAGYAVFRSETLIGNPVRLNDTLVSASSNTYSDNTVKDDVSYYYYIALYDSNGLASDLSSPAHAPAVIAPKTYVIIAAIGDYPGSGNDLDGPPYDLSNMKNALESGLPSVDVRTLLDSQATKAAIQQKVEDIEQLATADDTVVFFFSGHGTQGPAPTYEDEALCSYDSITTFGNLVTNKLITDDELEDWFSDYDTSKIVFIIDSCHSGGLVKTLTSKGARNTEITYKLGSSLNSMARDLNQAEYTVMMASDKPEYSYDSSDGGVYTLNIYEALTDEMSAVDTNSDRRLTPEEVHNWVRPIVVSQTQSRQNPTYWAGTQAGNIVLCQY